MLELEYQYYQDNKDKFTESYAGKFIVIKDSKILANYDSREEALRDTVKDHKLGTFLIQELLEETETQRFTSRVYV